MDLKARQVEARRVAAERGWTKHMSSEERMNLSPQDWEMYVDAFSVIDETELTPEMIAWTKAAIEKHEAIRILDDTAMAEGA